MTYRPHQVNWMILHYSSLVIKHRSNAYTTLSGSYHYNEPKLPHHSVAYEKD